MQTGSSSTSNSCAGCSPSWSSSYSTASPASPPPFPEPGQLPYYYPFLLALGWLLDDPCPFMVKSVLLSMFKIVNCPFMLIGWLLGDLVPCPFMSKIAILLNPRAHHTANMSADFFGQWRRALRQQAPPRSGFLLLFNKDILSI